MFELFRRLFVAHVWSGVIFLLEASAWRQATDDVLLQLFVVLAIEGIPNVVDICHLYLLHLALHLQVLMGLLHQKCQPDNLDYVSALASHVPGDQHRKCYDIVRFQPDDVAALMHNRDRYE